MHPMVLAVICQFDQLWKNIKIKTHDLTSFINKNIEEGLYTFGEGDFYIGDPLGVFRVPT